MYRSNLEPLLVEMTTIVAVLFNYLFKDEMRDGVREKLEDYFQGSSFFILYSCFI